MRFFSVFVSAVSALVVVLMLGMPSQAQNAVPVPPAKPGAGAAAGTATPTVAGAPAQSFGSWLFACPGQPKGNCLLIQQLSETLSRRVVFVWIVQ